MSRPSTSSTSDFSPPQSPLPNYDLQLLEAFSNNNVDLAKTALANGANPESIIINLNMSLTGFAEVGEIGEEMKVFLKPILDLVIHLDSIKEVTVRAYLDENNELKPKIIAFDPNANVYQILEDKRDNFSSRFAKRDPISFMRKAVFGQENSIKLRDLLTFLTRQNDVHQDADAPRSIRIDKTFEEVKEFCDLSKQRRAEVLQH